MQERSPAFARNVHRIGRATVLMGENSRGSCYRRRTTYQTMKLGAIAGSDEGKASNNSALLGALCSRDKRDNSNVRVFVVNKTTFDSAHHDTFAQVLPFGFREGRRIFIGIN